MRDVSLPRVVTAAGGLALLFLVLLPNLGDCQDVQSARRADLVRFFPVDLQASANHKLLDDFRPELPGNNLAGMAAGKQELLGLQFQIGASFIRLASSTFKKMPEKAEIKLGRKFTALHVLHAASGAVEKGQIPIGSFTLRYDDATTQTIPVVNRKDIFDWWKRPDTRDLNSAKAAWESSNDHGKKTGIKIRLFLSTWENPHPDRPVVSIEFASALTKAAPFCVAMTVSEPLHPRPAAKPLTAAELDRLWTQLAAEGTPACDAVETLAGAQAQAVPYLGRRIQDAQPATDVQKIAALISKLDDDAFAEREMASAELQKLGLDAAGPASSGHG